MITANSVRPTHIDTEAPRAGKLTAEDFTTKRFPRTTGEAFKDATYASALDGFPREQPDPLASFEAFLDYIDAHWPLWFACAMLFAASLACISIWWVH